MKKFCLFLFLFLFLALSRPVLALCPLCAVAVGAGIGFSQWLGIDDVISGLWIGALIVSLLIWNIDWFDKKNIKFRGRNLLTVLAYFSLVLLPLYFSGFIGNPLNTLCACPYLDRLLVGLIVGSLALWTAGNLHEYLKEKNGHHSYFPFQKVVIPLSLLLLLSFLFYFLV